MRTAVSVHPVNLSLISNV